MGVIAHEVGHAQQDAEGYRAMWVRTSIALRLQQLATLNPFVFI